MSQDPDTLIDTMEQLLALLVDEDQALRSFDVAAIAEAAERKTAFEETMRASLDPGALAPGWTAAQRDRLRALRTQVGNQARANLRRLGTSLTTVRSLLDHVTGATRAGYGPGRAVGTDVRPVLASEIG